MADSSGANRRTFLKIGGGAVVGLAVGLGAGYLAKPSTTSTSTVLSSVQGGTTTLTSSGANSTITTTGTGPTLEATQTVTSTVTPSQVTTTTTATVTSSESSAQIQLDTMTAFLTLGLSEQSLVSAIAETIIPDDSNGPGANAAGVVYFIDHVLAGDYGKNGNMYMQGPFIMSGQSGPLTIEGVTYSGGTPVQRIDAATRYQYQTNIREFIRYGLDAFEAYCNSAYGGNFESLTSANQMSALQDIWNNKPTSFNNILPEDFAYEITMLVWCGFLMDPVYGGNQNMVGWSYLGYNGVNQGNFYGEGYTTQQLMLSTTPIPLKPASLGQFQKGSP